MLTTYRRIHKVQSSLTCKYKAFHIHAYFVSSCTFTSSCSAKLNELRDYQETTGGRTKSAYNLLAHRYVFVMFFHAFSHALFSRKPFGHKQVAITVFCPAEHIQAGETNAPLLSS